MKAFLKVLAVNLAVLAVCLVVLELIFGNWFSPNRMNRLHLLKNITWMSDVSGLYHTAGTPSKITYVRDAFGLRGNYGSPAAINILTVGGSTTDERYISEGSTWPDILQKNLERGPVPLRVGNAGVSGQSSIGHLLNFDLWFPHIPRLKPQMVLFYVGINDVFYLNPEVDERLAVQQTDVAPKEAWLRTLIKERSAFFLCYSILKGMMTFNVDAHIAGKQKAFEPWYRRTQWTHRAAIEEPEVRAALLLDAYERRLRTLTTKTHELFAAKPIFVTQQIGGYQKEGNSERGIREIKLFDAKTTINGIDFAHILRAINQRTVKVCREMDCITWDLASELKLDLDDFYDYVHTTPTGSQKIGDYLSRKMMTHPI